jgi:hypothetical protein
MNAFSPPRHQTQRIEMELTSAQVNQLRAVIDNLPLSRYASLIVAVLPKLPLSADVLTPVTDAGPASNTPSGLGGFSLKPLTPKGREKLPEVERVLAQMFGGQS